MKGTSLLVLLAAEERANGRLQASVWEARPLKPASAIWEGFKTPLFQTLPRGVDNISQVGDKRVPMRRGTASADQLPLC